MSSSWRKAPRSDLIALGQCMAAAKGNTAAAEEIANRLEGKVSKPVELDVSGGLSLGERIAKARKRLAAGGDGQETG